MIVLTLNFKLNGAKQQTLKCLSWLWGLPNVVSIKEGNYKKMRSPEKGFCQICLLVITVSTTYTSQQPSLCVKKCCSCNNDFCGCCKNSCSVVWHFLLQIQHCKSCNCPVNKDSCTRWSQGTGVRAEFSTVQSEEEQQQQHHCMLIVLERGGMRESGWERVREWEMGRGKEWGVERKGSREDEKEGERIQMNKQINYFLMVKN